MGALIGSCIFGLVLIIVGIVFLKLQRKREAIIEFIAGGFFLILGLFAIILSIPKTHQLKYEHYLYSQFKIDYKQAAKICKIPYTLEKDTRKGAVENLFFLTNTTTLYINENKNKEIESFNISISGNKTEGVFDDSIYAIAIICAIEGFKEPNEAIGFINNVLNLPLDKYIAGKSGYKYSHGIQSENVIGFNISKTFQIWDEIVEKANKK